ncbi:unnamed protein product [Auanema sp. JU1783]|nr:unnamed protein product [Auanema sp. JU1783]
MNLWNQAQTRSRPEPTSHDIVKKDFRMEDVINVTCGSLSGKMHYRMFLCPGIHQICILLDGTNEMITPKEFTVRANKDKQKDWKGCIRIGKRSIRLLMALGLLDYFNHQEFCSLKCQSRNHIRGKSDEERCKSKNSSMSENPNTSLPSLHFPLGTSYSSNTFFLSAPSTVNGETGAVSIFKESSLNNSTVPYEFGIPHLDTPPEHSLINLLHIDPVSFWRELHRVGIITDVIDRIINRLKDCASYEDVTNVSMNLSRVVTALNLQYEVVQMFNEKQYVNLNDSAESVFETPNASSVNCPSVPTPESAVNMNKKPELSKNEFYLLNMLERSPETKVIRRIETAEENCEDMLYELPLVKEERGDAFTITNL